MYHVHLVTHTHWDREWYHPQVRFRQRLVALIDELLDDPPAPPASFLLDGQAIVLEDYLAVRPERAAELSTLLQGGRLEAGPWYVLADELIPAAESLVRNLFLGRRVLRSLRASVPPVLYCPDSFGHPATLPLLARGFGLPLIILWRGYGGRRWPAGDVFEWRAPDGEAVIVFHLPSNGYEYGSNLPVELDETRERWSRMRTELGERSKTGVLLLQNGADHHARQQRHRDAVASLARAAMSTGDRLHESSLTSFATELLRGARELSLPVVGGELRDSYGYAWTLQGTFATRAGQKRQNALAERRLVRDAEPWAALARAYGGSSRLPLVIAAWKTLLKAHPHDTLCGCSIDAVADAMVGRLADAMEQGVGIRDEAIADLLGHDAVAARPAPERWRPIIVVRNRAPRSRAGVAIIEIKQLVADVPVGPGSALARPVGARTARVVLPRLGGGSSIQVLGRRVEYDRVESPRHYPDNDLVAVTRAAIWLDSVAGYGTMSIPFGGRRTQRQTPSTVRVGSRELDNGLLRVTVDDAGRVALEEPSTQRRIASLIDIEDLDDRGDLYTASVRGAHSFPELRSVRVSQRGPLFGELLLRWRMVEAAAGKRARRTSSSLSVHIALEAAAPFVRISVEGVNRAPDHRLRLGFRTDVDAHEVWADAAFGPVRRERLEVPDEDRSMETPPPTAPLHRYVSVFDGLRGATLYSDGLAEYEASPTRELFVTLIRAVGELSRNDLPERPGHAGWPAPTPGAQSLGPFNARFALMLHGARSPAVIDAIERTADDVLLPLEGTTLRSALRLPEPTRG